LNRRPCVHEQTASLRLEIHGLGSASIGPAVDGLDLRVHAGELYTLLGPNGAGKTTTLRMVTGLLRPNRWLDLVFRHRTRSQTDAASGSWPWLSDEP